MLDFVEDFLVREDLLCRIRKNTGEYSPLVGNESSLLTGGDPLIRQTRPHDSFRRLYVVHNGKVDVQHPDKLRVELDDFEDVFSSKRIGAKPLFDLGQHLGVVGVVLVQDRGQRNVIVAETVDEMLAEDPPDVGIDGFLDCKYHLRNELRQDRKSTSPLLTAKLSGLEQALERCYRNTVHERGLLHDLINGAFNRWCARVGNGGQVKADDGHAVGKVFCLTAKK